MIEKYVFSPQYTQKLLNKTKPLFTIPAGLFTAKLFADNIAPNNQETDTFERKKTDIVVNNAISKSDEEFEQRKAVLISKIEQNKKISECKEFDKINKFNTSLIETILSHPEWLEKENFATCFDGIIRTTTTEEMTKATVDYINKVFEHPEILDDSAYSLSFKLSVTDASPKYSEGNPLEDLSQMTLALTRTYKHPELLKADRFLELMSDYTPMLNIDTLNNCFDLIDRLFDVYKELNIPPDLELVKNPITGLHTHALIKPATVAFDRIYALRGILKNNTIQILDALLHTRLTICKYEAKCSIFNDDGITEDDINARVEIIETLAKISNFPQDTIPNTVNVTTKDNIELAKELCNNKDFPIDKIADTLKAINKDNLTRAKELYENPDVPKYLIVYILQLEKNKKYAYLLALENIPWFDANAKNELSVEEMVLLYPTQKKLNFEKAEKSKRQPENISDLYDKIQQLIDICGHQGIAENYLKLCRTDDSFDSVKFGAMFKLAKAGIKIKDCKTIFSLSIGNHLSEKDGIFRPEIADDIIKMRECGLKRVDIATTLSAMKNMPEAELKSRFNNDIRRDFVERMNKLDVSIKNNLFTCGIDVNEICEKVIRATKDSAKTNEKTEKQKTEVREYADIDGMEKVILDRFKNEIAQTIWQNPDTFREWAERKLTDIIDFDKNKNYMAIGKHSKINDSRKQGIADWYKYLKEESNIRDDIFTQLFVIDGITKDMRPNNEISPPSVSSETFETVYNSLLEGISNVSFNEIYAEQIRKNAIKEYSKGTEIVDGVEGQWVSIPKTEKDQPDYIKHVAMVRALSEGSCWCLKSEQSAPSYLKKGDLHFFVDKDGKAIVAINEDSNNIIEIQRRYKQDSTIPVPYATLINRWAKENKYVFGDYSKKMETALSAKPKFDKLKSELTDIQTQVKQLLTDKKDVTSLTMEIFKKLDFGPTLKDDGTIILEKYTPIMPDKYTLSDLGIDENFIMQNVSEIHSNLNLEGSRLTQVPNLKVIGGTLTLGEYKTIDFHSLESLNGKKVTWIC